MEDQEDYFHGTADHFWEVEAIYVGLSNSPPLPWMNTEKSVKPKLLHHEITMYLESTFHFYKMAYV